VPRGPPEPKLPGPDPPPDEPPSSPPEVEPPPRREGAEVEPEDPEDSGWVTDDSSLVGEGVEPVEPDPPEEPPEDPVPPSDPDVTFVTVFVTVLVTVLAVSCRLGLVEVLGSGELTDVLGSGLDVEPPEVDVPGSGVLLNESVTVEMTGSEVVGSEVDGRDNAPVAVELPNNTPTPRPSAKTAIHLLRP
jgi:hypothetical protein